ncbi:MAG: hypothetical protein DRG34_05530, partial [Deltaproteobacteria bacterium]
MSEHFRKWHTSGAPTLVGSLPHHERQKAIDLVFEQIGEIPAWPQLSSYTDEQMMVQYSEGLPGLARKNDRIL